MGLTAKKVYAILNGKIKKISGDVSGLGTPLFYAGSVETADLLPLSPNTGAVYNIEQSSIYGNAGMNVAWNGEIWDPLGVSFDKSEMNEQIKLQVEEYLKTNPPTAQTLFLEEDGTLILKGLL